MPDPLPHRSLTQMFYLFEIHRRGLLCVLSTQSWPGSVKIPAGQRPPSTNRGRPTRPSNLWRISRDGTPLLATPRPFTAATRPGREKKLRDLWQLTDLPADEFANSVAQFYKCPRLTCRNCSQPHLSLVSFLTASCARWRSFRASSRHGGPHTLVVADPTDAASVRAAELTLGGRSRLPLLPLKISRLRWRSSSGMTRSPARTRPRSMRPKPTTISTVCAILRAAHPLCVPSMICWRKPIELRATDIHVEPFRNGMVLRMRVDGLLQVAPAPPTSCRRR